MNDLRLLCGISCLKHGSCTHTSPAQQSLKSGGCYSGRHVGNLKQVKVMKLKNGKPVELDLWPAVPAA